MDLAESLLINKIFNILKRNEIEIGKLKHLVNLLLGDRFHPGYADF
jgi:hypothetical protein